MKLRLVLKQGKRLLCCPNGSILNADDSILKRLLTDFKKPGSFKGTDGIWNALICDMKDYEGQTLAFVDDKSDLVIISPDAFKGFRTPTVYITASEYADLHGKSHPQIKKLCEAGRIDGIQQTRGGWIIPRDAPYPERKPREVKKSK